MHPYRMQQLIKDRDKDKVINVRRRASLYQTINRLQRAGLIAVHGTMRVEKWPERTVYELTEEGHRMVRTWMRQMLSTPAREFPEFPAAVAHLPLLSPKDALRQLEQRANALEEEMAQLDTELLRAAEAVPRLFLLEYGYLRAVRHAEASWVRSLIDDLRTGQLTWDEERSRSEGFDGLTHRVRIVGVHAGKEASTTHAR